jgi:poly(A) polymerase
MFRGETVEVSTFRASPEAPDGPEDWDAEREDSVEETPPEAGVEESSFGSPGEDARRRDFTVNALFYSIADFSVIDYVDGLEDLRTRTLRTIGHPDRRFAEDPVRMLRAVEYSARVDLRLEAETEAGIERCHGLIADAAPARLTYELMETLRSARCADICAGWRRLGLLEPAFPDLAAGVAGLDPILREIDRRVGRRDRLHDASLLAALFLPQYLGLLDEVWKPGSRLDNAALLSRMRELLGPAAARMHVANRTLHLMHHGLFTLTKMWRPPERGRQVVKLARYEFFPVAWDLYSIGAAADLLPRDGWTAWSRALARLRRQGAEGVDQVVERQPPKKRRRRRRPRRRRNE